MYRPLTTRRYGGEWPNGWNVIGIILHYENHRREFELCSRGDLVKTVALAETARAAIERAIARLHVCPSAFISRRVKRPILIHPDPRLKVRSDPVPDLSDGLRALADDMLETMYDAPGIGLAAPQVGMAVRLIVLDCEKGDDATPKPTIMFNPEILAASGETATYEEGCLSIPEQFADVTRPAEVTVRWIDRDGAERQEDMGGLWSTCVQHEIDHLDGRLFIDYLKPLKRQMITRKMVKFKRERAREKA